MAKYMTHITIHLTTLIECEDQEQAEMIAGGLVESFDLNGLTPAIEVYPEDGEVKTGYFMAEWVENKSK